jgi:hypothetical protein
LYHPTMNKLIAYRGLDWDSSTNRTKMSQLTERKCHN